MKPKILKALLNTVFIWPRNTVLEQSQFFFSLQLLKKYLFSLLRNSKSTMIKSTVMALKWC